MVRTPAGLCSDCTRPLPRPGPHQPVGALGGFDRGSVASTDLTTTVGALCSPGKTEKSVGPGSGVGRPFEQAPAGGFGAPVEAGTELGLGQEEQQLRAGLATGKFDRRREAPHRTVRGPRPGRRSPRSLQALHCLGVAHQVAGDGVRRRLGRVGTSGDKGADGQGVQARALRLADLFVEGLGKKGVGELDLATGRRPAKPCPHEHPQRRRHRARLYLGHRRHQKRLEADPGHAGCLGDRQHRRRQPGETVDQLS